MMEDVILEFELHLTDALNRKRIEKVIATPRLKDNNHHKSSVNFHTLVVMRDDERNPLTRERITAHRCFWGRE